MLYLIILFSNNYCHPIKKASSESLNAYGEQYFGIYIPEKIDWEYPYQSDPAIDPSDYRYRIGYSNPLSVIKIIDPTTFNLIYSRIVKYQNDSLNLEFIKKFWEGHI